MGEGNGGWGKGGGEGRTYPQALNPPRPGPSLSPRWVPGPQGPSKRPTRGKAFMSPGRTLVGPRCALASAAAEPRLPAGLRALAVALVEPVTGRLFGFGRGHN